MFQLILFKIYAVIKTVYCFNWMPLTFVGISHWEVFLEINLIKKTLKFYTSWVHWKNQCRSTVRKHALLWNKHEYQHFADIFVKNIFNRFSSTGLFLYFILFSILFYTSISEVYRCFQRSFMGYFRLKLSSTSRCCPRWLIFFQKFILSKQI